MKEAEDPAPVEDNPVSDPNGPIPAGRFQVHEVESPAATRRRRGILPDISASQRLGGPDRSDLRCPSRIPRRLRDARWPEPSFHASLT